MVRQEEGGVEERTLEEGGVGWVAFWSESTFTAVAAAELPPFGAALLGLGRQRQPLILSFFSFLFFSTSSLSPYFGSLRWSTSGLLAR